MTTTRGWYPDPWQQHQLRWWDGADWTAWVLDEPETGTEADPRAAASTDPLGGPVVDAARPAPGRAAEVADRRHDVADFLGWEARLGAIPPDQQRRLLSDLAAWVPADAREPVLATATAAVVASPSPPATAPPGAAPAPSPAALLPPPPVAPPLPPPPPAPPLPPPPPAWPGSTGVPIEHHRPRIGAELAVHGLAYAGVALLFTGLLGFVIFAFGSVGNALRPIAEVAIGAALFGAGAFLRRRSAPVAGDALVLLAGLATPVLLVAAFVDGATVPPDLHGSALALVLAACMVAASGAFALAVRHRPDSPLRFVVVPTLWWATAALGLSMAESTNTGRQVATPVPWQWALVALAVAASLTVVELLPDGILSRPTRLAAAIGAPLAWFITMTAAGVDGWPPAPVLVVGVASVASIALLLKAHPVSATWAMAGAIVATAAGCSPGFGAGWCAAGTAVALLALVEVLDRTRPEPVVESLLVVAALLAAFVAVAEPWAAVAAGALVTAWSFARSEVTLRGAGTELGAVGASIAPLIALMGLWAATSFDATLGAAAALVVAVAIAVRIAGRERTGTFESGWVVTSAAIVALGASIDPVDPGALAVLAALAAATSLALLPRWTIARLWTAAPLAVWAGWLALATADVGTATRSVALAAVALAVITLGQWRRTAVRGHVALLGHALAAASVAAMAGAVAGDHVLVGWRLWAPPLVLTAFAAGWVVTAVAEALGGVTAQLWDAAHLRWLPTALAVPTVSIALVDSLVAGGAVSWRDGWTAVVALVVPAAGAVVARALTTARPHVARTLAESIWWSAPLGLATVGRSAPLATAAAIGAGAVALTDRRLRRLDTVWLGWVLSGVATAAVATLVDLSAVPVHRALLAWAALLVVGGLLVDDHRHGRRERGQVVRSPYLWPPVALGAVVGPLSLLALAEGERIEAAVTLLAASALVALVAVLLRQPWASAPAWALAVAGTWSVLPEPLVSRPWTGVALAAVVLVAAAVLDRLVTREWALPAFVVAHAPLIVALAAAPVVGWVPATWLSGGAVLAVIAIRLRSMAWLVAAVPIALVGAAAAGPGWLTLGLALTTAVSTVLAARSTGTARILLQLSAAGSAAGTWAALWWWLEWSVDTGATRTLLASTALIVAMAVSGRWARLGHDWLAVIGPVAGTGLLVGGELVALGQTDRSSGGTALAAALLAAAAAAALLARPLAQAWMRELSGVVAAVAALVLAWATGADGVLVVAVAVGVAVVATVGGAAALVVRPGAWARPALVLGGTAELVSLVGSLVLLPDRGPVVAATLAGAVVLLAVGLATRQVGWLAAAPFALLAAWTTWVSGSVTDPQWFTLPLGVAVLASTAVVRADRRRSGADPAITPLVLTDVLGMAFVALPALIETAFRDPAHALVALACGGALVGYGVVTRVRRRLAAGAATILLTLVLVIVSPLLDLSGADPSTEGWVPWAILAGLGALALLGAALVERGRQAVQRGVRAFREATAGWE